jgi:hypothetical protein
LLKIDIVYIGLGALYYIKMSKLIYVPNIGPKYTLNGENETLIQLKAYAFKENYSAFIEKGVNALSKPNDVDDTAWNEVISVFTDKDGLQD